jgi:hypothetical protein
MRSKFRILGFLLLFSPCLLTDTASAIVVNGQDFALLAQNQINLSNGPITINGNVGVNNPGGLLKLGGINVEINGTAISDFTILNKGSRINGTLKTNHLNGTGTATTIQPAPPLPFVTPFPSVPATDACVDSAPVKTVPPGQSVTLPSGSCFSQLKIGDNATVTLAAGGIYNFGSVQMLKGSTLTTGAAGADIHVKKSFGTEGSNVVENVNVLVSFNGSNRAIAIGQNSKITGNLEAPNAIIHIHDGSNIFGEVVGLVITIEPATVTFPPSCCPVGQECKPI